MNDTKTKFFFKKNKKTIKIRIKQPKIRKDII
jgi:hypothetical protein